MSVFVVDVESDGQVPGPYSMVCFGAVKVDSNLDIIFKGLTKPISDIWVPDSLAVSGISRQEHENFPEPKDTMTEFYNWVMANNIGKAVFMSDNLAFDWQFINYYFHVYLGKNPFGWSGRRIGDLYAGAVKTWGATSDWKKLRKTKHTHDPVDDARGNAEALLIFCHKFGIKLPTN